VYLDHGRVTAFGDTEGVIKQYRETVRLKEQERVAAERAINYGIDTASVSILSFEMFGDDGQDRRRFTFGESVRIRIRLRASRRLEAPLIDFGIKRSDGVIICNFNNWFDNFKIDYLEGECEMEGWLPPLRLIPHRYEIHVLVWQRQTGYAAGDFSRLRPLAAKIFGDFTIEGPPLTEADGVYQEPARKWVFTRGDKRIEHLDIGADSLSEAYGKRRERTLTPV
jgi:hypothetical protein